MKKVSALILALILILSTVSCGTVQENETGTEPETTAAEIKKNAYVLSEDVKEGSVIDGVMTDIKTKDPILEKTVASWLDTCVLYEVNIRQFTQEGTFAAFENHLDRLKDMGINTLWLMPIHPISETNRKGTLGSYYSVNDYRAVNPEFGTMDDFKHLLDKAHGMGFKVIIDWVANHTGWDNGWIKEHDDWYSHNDKGEIESPYDWTDTAQLDYGNYEMRAEMIKCMQYWIEDIGIDGFRCDHAVGVPGGFWNAAVYKLKSVNSEIMMLAEASGAQSLTGYAFDSCYNDDLYGDCVSIKNGISISGITDSCTKIDLYYADGSFPMNYLDNHDKNAYDGTIVGRCADAIEALFAFIYIAPGMPLIYTSNEQGYNHQIEFFEKDAVAWDENPKYADLIKSLSELKVNNKALASTNRAFDILETSDQNIVACSRTAEGNKVVYIANLYNEEIKNASVIPGFENAKCVMHFDEKTLDLEEKEMKASDFENKDYNPYEFYVLTAD